MAFLIGHRWFNKLTTSSLSCDKRKAAISYVIKEKISQKIRLSDKLTPHISYFCVSTWLNKNGKI